MNSQILRDYLDTDDSATHADASRRLFEHYGPRIHATVHERLRRRYGEMAGEVVQEAWLRCLSELRARKTQLMQSRPKRPSVGLLMAANTVRAVWALEQRARREHKKHCSLDELQPTAASERPTDTEIDPEDLHAIFEAVWEELLQASSPAQRAVLLQTGPVLFFAGDWKSDATDAHAAIIAQRLAAARKILKRILRDRYGLSDAAIRRFLHRLFG